MQVYRGLQRAINNVIYAPTPARFASDSVAAVSKAVSRFRIRKRAPHAQFSAGDSGSAEFAEASLHTKAHGSIIRLVEILIEDARAARASDIHIDPRTHVLRVRLRVDGFLLDAHEFPISIHAELISRIKILAGLRIDEHYAAQDGRFKLLFENGPPVDVRVSVAPTYYGENAVLRLLVESAEAFSLESLSFTPENRLTITRAMKRPYGMILATGPTGSGKTTTLYTFIKILNAPGVSVITLEDPIEYSMPGVSQIQLNPKTGLTFGTGLRSVLRQDPDIIMVGEIRDAESAGLAVNAALTGHRMLSTLHTGNAAGTITRLLDMGIEPYLVASTVSLAVGQRLLRRICDACKYKRSISAAELKAIEECMPRGISPMHLQCFVGAGCERCRGTGYHGRVGAQEVLEITPALCEAILARKPSSEIETIARAGGMVPIAIDAIDKAWQGVTTIEEALKAAYE